MKKEELKEMTFETAQWLVSCTGISYSEALGYVLGVKNPTYGWETELSEEEFNELLEKHDESILAQSGRDDLPF